ncbi:MAG: hypothetical protein WA750_05100, partial [Pseudolabrys sp.]
AQRRFDGEVLLKRDLALHVGSPISDHIMQRRCVTCQHCSTGYKKEHPLRSTYISTAIEIILDGSQLFQ